VGSVSVKVAQQRINTCAVLFNDRCLPVLLLH